MTEAPGAGLADAAETATAGAPKVGAPVAAAEGIGIDGPWFREFTRSEMRGRRDEPWLLFKLGARTRSPEIVDELARGASAGTLDLDGLRAALHAEGPQAIERHDWHPLGAVLSALLACVLDPTAAHCATASLAVRGAAAAVASGEEEHAMLIPLLVQAATIAEDAEALEVLRTAWEHAEAALTARAAAAAAAEAAAATAADGSPAELAETEPADAELAEAPESVEAAETSASPHEAESRFWAAEVDRLRGAALDGGPEALDAWWGALNRPILDSGVEPFVFDAAGRAGAARFDAVFAAIHAPVVPDCSVAEADQPLVTVIVPSYNPDAGFLSTVESLVRQSWRALEVLVIDDCSPRGAEFFQQAAELDERVRVIRMPQNGGAYLARNAGLREARGEYVTFLDADDISHPRRIELQTRALLEDPQLVGSTSRSLRLLSDGRLTYFGYAPTRTNMSSLLFRRDAVLDRLGRFDLVRKDADSEFEARLTRAFGKEALRRMDEVLSLVQLTVGSLSRSDFRFGWMAEDRATYKMQFRGRHTAVLEQAPPGEDGRPDAGAGDWRYGDAAGERAASSLALPPAMRGGRAPERTRFAILADWEDLYAKAEDWAAVVPALRRIGGEPVGLLNGVQPRLSTFQRGHTTQAVWGLVEQEQARWIGWADDTEIDTLIVTDPEYFGYLPDPAATRLRARRVVVAMEGSTRRVRDRAALPPVAWFDARIAQVFGVRPVWLTPSTAVAGTLAELGADARIGSLRYGWAEAGSAAPARPSPGADPMRPRRIGLPWHSSRDRVEWVPRRLRRALPAADAVAVSIYDETGGAEAYLGEDAEWGIVDGGAVSRADFLDGVDALLLDPFDRRLLAAPSWIAEAVERGVPVLAPRSYDAEFGPLVSTFVPGGSANHALLLALDDELRAERAAEARAHAARLPGIEAAEAAGAEAAPAEA